MITAAGKTFVFAMSVQTCLAGTIDSAESSGFRILHKVLIALHLLGKGAVTSSWRPLRGLLISRRKVDFFLIEN